MGQGCVIVDQDYESVALHFQFVSLPKVSTDIGPVMDLLRDL